MKLTPSQIRYLLAIYRLNGDGVVRSSEIADSLAVTKPSVHRMTTQLSKMNLITKKRYSFVSMTQRGRGLAQKYQALFWRIIGLLCDTLSLPSDSAEKGALVILSGLNMERLETICS